MERERTQGGRHSRKPPPSIFPSQGDLPRCLRSPFPPNQSSSSTYSDPICPQPRAGLTTLSALNTRVGLPPLSELTLPP
ncbi:hypothetical protein CLOM_g16245 [Closterium sp. NIES-68]|nr:hypothetical protein CLOM_g16245 [Closterium sp. NIES-68]